MTSTTHHYCPKWRDHHNKRIFWEFVPQAIQRFQNYLITTYGRTETFFNAFSRSCSKFSWQLMMLNSKVKCKVQFREILARLANQPSPCSRNSDLRLEKLQEWPTTFISTSEKMHIQPRYVAVYMQDVLASSLLQSFFEFLARTFWLSTG